jgi:hypothetical protein
LRIFRISFAFAADFFRTAEVGITLNGAAKGAAVSHMKCMNGKRIALALVLVTAPAIYAQPAEPAAPPPTWYDTVHADGFVDVYYAWNANSPQSHDNFIAGTGTTAARANEFGLNLAAVELVQEAKPLGFHLSLMAGNGAEIVHAGEPAGSATGSGVFRNIYEASVSYLAPAGKGLLLTAGTFPSHIGFEAFYSKDNWQYTRGWLGELSPYYQTGIKAAYSFNDHWSAQIHVLNGWQLIGDNNDGKSLGTQVAYASDRLSASLNTFAGPELPHDNSHLRLFGDLVATYKATPKLSLGASIDRGRQELPGNTAANWLGIAGYGRYDIDQKHAFAIRVERFRDPDNGISGTAQTLSEATLTYTYRPVKNLLLRMEARQDHSTAAVFERHQNDKSRNQTLAMVSAVVTFGQQ